MSQHAYVNAWQPSTAENSTVQIGHAPFSALLSNAAPSYGCHSDAPLPFVSPSSAIQGLRWSPRKSCTADSAVNKQRAKEQAGVEKVAKGEQVYALQCV